MAANLLELAPLGEHVGDRDRVHGFAPGVLVDNRVEDELVGRTVEVASLENLADLTHRLPAQEHRPEHTLLGGDVLWGSSVRQLPAVELDHVLSRHSPS